MDRKTDQYLMPYKDEGQVENSYNIYPSFSIDKGAIHCGINTLAKELSKHDFICIDGYIGVNWEFFIKNLTTALSNLKCRYNLIDIKEYVKSVEKIEEM